MGLQVERKGDLAANAEKILMLIISCDARDIKMSTYIDNMNKALTSPLWWSLFLSKYHLVLIFLKLFLLKYN